MAQRRPALLAALLVTLGCVGGGTVRVAPARPQHPERVVLAPVSFNQSLPEFLEPGVGVMREQIRGYLEARDCEVVAPGFASFHDQWKTSAGEIETLYDASGELVPERFDAAVATLAAALREQGQDFDALVLPYLQVREGTFRGKSVTWDGVRRKLRIDYEHHDVYQVGFDRGTMPTTSIHLLVYDAEGRKQLDSYGGLELVLEMAIKGDRYYWLQRKDLFEETDSLRDGIRVAFEPYFGD